MKKSPKSKPPPEEVAWNRVLRFLALRPRSTQEVTFYLKHHLHVSEEIVSNVIEKLIALEFLDDRAFARWWIDQRMRTRPKGVRLLAMELQQKGIRKDVLQDVFSDYLGNQSRSSFELEAAKKILEKRLPRLKHLPPDVRWRRAMSFLSRRGFPLDIAWTAIREDLKVDTDRSFTVQ